VYLPLVPLVCSKTFFVYMLRRIPEIPLVVVAPASLEISRIVLHSRVRYPYIYVFATEIVVYNWSDGALQCLSHAGLPG